MNGFHLPGAPLPVPAMSARMPLPPYARHGYMPIAPMFRPQDILQMERIYVRGIIPQARMHAGQVADRALREAALSAVMLLRDVEANMEGAAPANPTKQAAKDAGAWMMSQAAMPEHARDRVHVAWVAKALLEAGALQDDGGEQRAKALRDLTDLARRADEGKKNFPKTNRTSGNLNALDATTKLAKALKDLADKRKVDDPDTRLKVVDALKDAYIAVDQLSYGSADRAWLKNTADRATAALDALQPLSPLADEADLRQLANLIGYKSPVKAFVSPLLTALGRASRYRGDQDAQEALAAAAAQLSAVADTVADTGDGLLASEIAREVAAPTARAAGFEAERAKLRGKYANVIAALTRWAKEGPLPQAGVRALILVRKLVANPGDMNARDEARNAAELLMRIGDPNATAAAKAIDAATR